MQLYLASVKSLKMAVGLGGGGGGGRGSMAKSKIMAKVK